MSELTSAKLVDKLGKLRAKQEVLQGAVNDAQQQYKKVSGILASINLQIDELQAQWEALNKE